MTMEGETEGKETVKPLTVKDFSPEDQPREKAERFGCGVLSVPELWALVLRTGTPGMPITQLCRQLMGSNQGSLHRLERRTRQELRQIKGIGLTKSIQIEAVMELVKRFTAEDPIREEPLKSSHNIWMRMRDRIGNLPHEEVWATYTNRRNVPVGDFRVSAGTATASLFDVKPIIKHALLENAENVILTHNHPSGNNHPSTQDDKITHELQTACRTMNLRLLDHVIVCAAGYYSYFDNGRL